MDEVIKLVVAKAGVSEEQARKAVETVAGFVKDRVPALAGPIDGLLQGGSNPLGDIGGKLGGLFGGK